MKKLMGMLTIGALFFFGATNCVMAQEEAQAAAPQEETVAATGEIEATEATVEESAVAATATELTVESKTFHQVLKEKFIQGGAGWMTPILLVLIIGLTLIIERIIYLNLLVRKLAIN